LQEASVWLFRRQISLTLQMIFNSLQAEILC
jgi:hypothetical protein